MLKRNDIVTVGNDLPDHLRDQTLDHFDGDYRVETKRVPLWLVVVRSFAQVIIVGAVLLGAYLVMQRLVATAPERPSRPAIDVIIPVSADVVGFADHRPTISIFGEVVAAQSIDMRPAISGEIVDVHPALSSGSIVKAGEMLVRFDDFDVRGAVTEAKANLAQTEAAIAENDARIAAELAQIDVAQTQFDLARSDLDRAQTLRNSGSLTEKQIEERQLVLSQRAAAVTQRQSNVAIERARLAQQQAQRDRLIWKVEQAERALDDVEIRAPFEGVVLRTTAEIGKQAGPSDVLATLYSNVSLDVRFTLTNAQYGRLSDDNAPLIGRDLVITWDVGGTAYNFEATITRLGAEVASARGGVEIFGRVKSQAQAVTLRPGAFVSIQVPDKIYPQSVQIPETAIFSGSRAFIIAADGTLEERNVTIVAYDGPSVIISAGLNEGEAVLTTRLTEIDGATKVGAISGSAKGAGADLNPRRNAPSRTEQSGQ